jgi:hypothetical protein
MDSRLAGNIRHMLAMDQTEIIPKSLVQRIERVQVLLTPFARPIDIQHLAVIIADWEKETSDYKAGQPLEYDGEEVFFVRRPGGKQAGKLHVRTSDMDKGRYKVVDESKVSILEVV